MDALSRLEQYQVKVTKDDNAYREHLLQEDKRSTCGFEIIGYSVITSGDNRRYISPKFNSVTEVFDWLRNRMDIAQHIGEKYRVSREQSIN